MSNDEFEWVITKRSALYHVCPKKTTDAERGSGGVLWRDDVCRFGRNGVEFGYCRDAALGMNDNAAS